MTTEAEIGDDIEVFQPPHGGAAWQSFEELQTYTDVETGEVSKKWRLVPDDIYRCTGKIRSKQNPWRGNRCGKVHEKGTTVCKQHGARLPVVKKAAQRRLALAADAAAKQLVYIAVYKKGVEDKDRIKAIIEVLNRAGVEGKTTIELEIKPWQEVLQRVYGQMNDGERIRAVEDDDDEAEVIDLDTSDYEVLAEDDARDE